MVREERAVPEPSSLPPETEPAAEESPQSTAAAPPFRPLETRPGALARGERLDDFEVLGTLGRGSFATVYLARQLSLDRQVALKVSPDRGHEARTLAGLEHDHIVRVFSESADRRRGLRLLCMQLVPGTTLEQVMRALASVPRPAWSGRAILDAIDALASLSAPFDASALRDRDFLARCDFIEAVGWLGARLAEALTHAHSRGVLHRDIKPANILLNRYGRPLLADFNIAFDARRTGDLFGGTLAYMAPEHLDAFNPEALAKPDEVDERADVYSLGVVLFELLAGELPFSPPRHSGRVAEVLKELAEERRSHAPDLPADVDIPGVVRRIVRRCLAPWPVDRYQQAAELAEALEGCGELHRMRTALPAGGRLTRAALRRPFLLLALLVFLPHLFGSAVNISYNAVRIVTELTGEQRELFARLTLIYNAVVYPLCLVVLGWLLLPVLRVWNRLEHTDPTEDLPVDEFRHNVLRWPLWAICLSCAGWLPGGLLFPLVLHTLAGPLPPAVFGHFLLSFTISGLIATTYSLFAMQYLVLRILYPSLWTDTRQVRERAAAELRPLDRRLGLFQLLAGLIPLVGAVLMIGAGPDELTHAGYRTFRVLVTALVGLGVLGVCVANATSRRLQQTLSVLVARQGSTKD
jgi:hypothetical protein